MGGFLDKPIVDKVTEVGQGKIGSEIIRYSASSMQGWRMDMEDAHVTQLGVGGKELGMFCCFDGHAGKLVAQHAAANINRILCMQASFENAVDHAESLAEALKETYLDLDEDLLQLPQIEDGSNISGCTAISLAITPTHFVVANAGDSRLIIVGDGGKVLFSTKDHKPDDPIESQRIQKAGATVVAHRVNGDLALSRALGDFSYKKVAGLSVLEQPVTASPDVSIIPRTDSQQFAMIACDGIWDVMSNEDVAKFYLEKMTTGYGLGRCNELLLDHCLELGSRDNMTAIVIALKSAPKQIGTFREPVNLNPAATPGTPNGNASTQAGAGNSSE